MASNLSDVGSAAAYVALYALPVVAGSAMGAKNRLRRISSAAHGQPLRIEQTANLVFSGTVLGGLGGAALSAAVAALLEWRR
jgi:hypothetical protein